MDNRIKISPREQWLEYAQKGQLAYQICVDDGQPVFYPRVVAPQSGSTNLEWRVSAGNGVVYATTAVMQRDQAAYNIAIIEMDEGFRLLSRVEGLDAEQVKIGSRVEVHFRRDDGGGDPYPVFRLAGVAQ